MKLPRPVTEIWTANRLENGAARERAIVNHAGRDVPEAPSREAQIAQAAAPTSVMRALRVRGRTMRIHRLRKRKKKPRPTGERG
jgi:hypothetical protein